ncbi:MFS transporter [Candidatus Stoquefichus massiliensis]|uniref:MFS transporter n=1 Tax=Candidatus Stoquefichus massiliensis TaxID=1470350 RepID=UPI0004843390|nr:MFS transporter [Candidatus Stoquefichus massiliensis]
MNKHLYLNYIYEFLLNFKLTALLWPTFLIVKGFSLIDVGICESVFHMTSLLGEMPTGIISDLYGRRLSRLLGRLIDIISVLLLIVAKSEWLIYLSFMLSALSYTMESGTDSAYVYDLLLEEQKQDNFPKIQGRKEVVIQGAILLATIIGGMLAGISYQLTYGLSVIIILISIIVLMQMKEIKNQHHIKTNVLNDIKMQLVQSYQLIKKDHQIFYLILSTSLFSASLTTCYFYLTNNWSELGISISLISFSLALENIVGMVAGLLTYRIIKKYSQKRLLLILPLGIVLSIMGIPFYPFSILSICTMAFFETILYIAMTSFLNEKVSSQYRATLLSTLSLGFSTVMIVYFPAVGLIGEIYGLKMAYLCLFIIVLIIYIIYQHVIRKKYEKEDSVL